MLGPRGERARARVIRASPVIDPASGTREVVLQLVAGDRLPPGSSVTVRIGSELRRVVAVPREAIGEGYALVWDADRTSLRQVTVGGELPGERVEVVSGLAPGEKVVRTGPMSERPRLRTDLVLVEQTYRGEQSFIVKDPSTRKYFRFRPVEIAVMQSLDGQRTVGGGGRRAAGAGPQGQRRGGRRASPRSSRRWGCASGRCGRARCC